MIAKGSASLSRLGELASWSCRLLLTEWRATERSSDLRETPAVFTDFSEPDAPAPLLAAGLIRPPDRLTYQFLAETDERDQVATGSIRPARNDEVRAYHRAWARRRYLQRIDEGRCIRCGKLTENGPRCRICQSLHRTMRSGRWDAKARAQRQFSRWALQDERRQAGRCVLCGEPYRGKFVRCQRCRTRERQRPSYLRRQSGDAA